MVGSTGGVTSSNGLGINYVDQWGEKWKVTGSYFFNQSDNLTQQQTEREYFDSSLPGMTYSEYQESSMKNWNHRFNMKLDYQISNRTSLQFRPTLSFQNNDRHGLLQPPDSHITFPIKVPIETPVITTLDGGLPRSSFDILRTDSGGHLLR